MDIQRIITDLKQERERLDKAISILEELSSGPRRGRPAASPGAKRKRRHMSAVSRKRISQMMKQRWAKRIGRVRKRRDDDWCGPLINS